MLLPRPHYLQSCNTAESAPPSSPFRTHTILELPLTLLLFLHPHPPPSLQIPPLHPPNPYHPLAAAPHCLCMSNMPPTATRRLSRNISPTHTTQPQPRNHHHCDSTQPTCGLEWVALLLLPLSRLSPCTPPNTSYNSTPHDTRGTLPNTPQQSLRPTHLWLCDIW